MQSKLQKNIEISAISNKNNESFFTASVATQASLFHFDREFFYRVPNNLCNKIVPGKFVYVPFGNLKKKILAVVLSTKENSYGTLHEFTEKSSKKLKKIISLINNDFCLTSEFLELALWMKKKYYCTIFDVVKSVIQIKILKRKKINQTNKNTKNNIKTKKNCYEKIASLKLNFEQAKILDDLVKDLKSTSKKPSLLYGITGSGKTYVFIKLISEVLKLNKSVIVLVPEISLTPQIIKKFRSFFKDELAVLHSGLTDRDRALNFKKIQNSTAKIIIGTRSAVFAPVKNLGAIIIDEEHESSYKSESTPRYHAREVAKFRANFNNALLLLASATPSIESFFKAKTEVYKFYSLKTRYSKNPLPKVSIVDINKIKTVDEFGIFSEKLFKLIKKNLFNNKQSILLLNRRGHDTLVICPYCKSVVTCKNCSVAMSYHLTSNCFICHYCGAHKIFSVKCECCNEERICFCGIGTQKIESLLNRILPEARTLRIDSDTANKKEVLEKKISEFCNNKYDILIGTQMVAKGLNFENVTLVGVLSVDMMLHAPDFRSFEKTFSLLTQVVGRSGRGKEVGEAVIQTFIPNNQIIKLAATQNFESFYSNEIQIRKAMLYPPFVNLMIMVFSSQKEEKAKNASNNFFEIFIKKAKKEFSFLPLRIIGPNKAHIFKVKNKFRYKIIIKYRDCKNFREMIKSLILQFLNSKNSRNISFYVDDHPLSFP
jgi:primosomal protein N' (replication factor Y)